MKRFYCYKCTFGGLVSTCSTCWRSYHKSCSPGKYCGRCINNIEFSKLPEEIEKQVKDLEDAIKRVPPRIADFIGRVEKRDPLDTLFFHRLMYGQRTDHKNLAVKLRPFYNKKKRFEFQHEVNQNNKSTQECIFSNLSYNNFFIKYKFYQKKLLRFILRPIHAMKMSMKFHPMFLF